jgi:hypothetical protein
MIERGGAARQAIKRDARDLPVDQAVIGIGGAQYGRRQQGKCRRADWSPDSTIMMADYARCTPVAGGEARALESHPWFNIAAGAAAPSINFPALDMTILKILFSLTHDSFEFLYFDLRRAYSVAFPATHASALQWAFHYRQARRSSETVCPRYLVQTPIEFTMARPTDPA